MSATKRRHKLVGAGAGIAGQLREIIVGRGLTAYSVAHSAGIAPSVVSRFLSRERGLTLETFDALAGALGLRLVETAKGRRPARAGRPSPADLVGAGDVGGAVPDDVGAVVPDRIESDGPRLCQLAEPPESPDEGRQQVGDVVGMVEHAPLDGDLDPT
jgi:transcriptional regulator with XRE-family HTH domain